MKIIATLLMMAWAGATFGHEGHGISGSHWHASDLWGFGVMATVLALWLARRK